MAKARPARPDTWTQSPDPGGTRSRHELARPETAYSKTSRSKMPLLTRILGALQSMLQTRSCWPPVSAIPPAILIAGWTLLAGLAIPPPACGQGALATGAPTPASEHLSLGGTGPFGPQGGAVLRGGASPIGLRPVPLQAQSGGTFAGRPRWAGPRLPSLERRSRLLRGHGSLGLDGPKRLPTPIDDGERSRFSQALIGSAVGTAVGGLLGTLLLVASAPDDTRPYENDDDREELQGTALLLMLGGPPAGAILNTDIARDDAGAWALSVLGELVLGGAGAGLGALVGGSDTGAAVGALVLGAPGVTVGAAGGAHLAAPSRTRGARRYSRDDGQWTRQWPTVRAAPQPGLESGSRPELTGEMTLMTVER